MSILKKASKFGGGVITAQAITAASIPVLSRLYAPADFSTFGLYFAISSLLTPLICLRAETLLPKHEDPASQISTVYSIAVFTVLPLTFITFIVLFMTPGTQLFQALMNSVIIVTSSAVFCFFNILSLIHVRNNEIGRLNLARILRSALSTTLQSLLSFITRNGLFIGESIARLVGLVVLSKKNHFHLRPKKARQLLGDNSRFLRIVTVSSLFNALGVNIYPILAMQAYNATQVGQYFFAHKILSAPATIVAQSISISLLGDFQNLIKQDKQQITRRAKKVSILLAVGSSILFLSISAILYYFGGIILGEKWIGVSDYVLIMTPLLIGQITFSPYSQILMLVNGEKKQLYWDAIRVAMIVVSIAAPMLIGNESNFKISALIYSVSGLVMYWVHYRMVMSGIRKFKNPN